MGSKKIICLVLLLLGLMVFINVLAKDMEADYIVAVADYYNATSYETINEAAGMLENIEDLPVVCLVAKKAGVYPHKVAKFRQAGQSWRAICQTTGVTSSDYYVMINANYKSKVFSPILGKYKNTLTSQWKSINFTDEEIINLVNLKFVSSHHDYSIFDVMAMRDFGKTFVRINSQVEEVKRELIEKQVAENNKNKEGEKN